jgi:hypothetical protein
VGTRSDIRAFEFVDYFTYNVCYNRTSIVNEKKKGVQNVEENASFARCCFGFIHGPFLDRLLKEVDLGGRFYRDHGR